MRRIEGNAQKSGTDAFIEMALNKINIHKYVSGETSEEELSAVLIFKDKEGPDAGILYTYATDGLSVGDSIVKLGSREEDNVYYLIVEEVKRVDTSVVIKVYNVLETNVLANSKRNTERKPAYLQSNLRHGIRTSAQSGNVLELKKAVLVTPSGYGITLDEKLNIQNLITKEESYASWLVEGIDDVSTPGINFIHLSQVLKDEIDESPQPELDKDEYKPYDEITLVTEGGFVRTSPDAYIVDRSANEVVVRVPEGTNSLIITVKIGGENISHEYVIRG